MRGHEVERVEIIRLLILFYIKMCHLETVLLFVYNDGISKFRDNIFFKVSK